MFRSCLIALLFILLSAPVSAAGLTNDQWERRVTMHVNHFRLQDGDLRVTQGACVDRFSERWAKTLEREDRFEHRPTLAPIWRRCNAARVGEVIARGFETPYKTVVGWMNSPSHRKALLRGAYDRIGVGVKKDESGIRYVVANLIAK